LKQPPPRPVLAVQRVMPSYEQVAGQLRELILSRELPPGSRLPAEGELSALFGVGKSTTREALRLLAAENLISTRRGAHGGTFVVQPEPREVQTAVAQAVRRLGGSGHIQVEEIIEVWSLLEPTATRSAAQHRSAEDLERLFKACELPENASDEQLAAKATEFHAAVLQASGNKLLELICQPLSDLAPTLQRASASKVLLHTAGDEHRAIAQAIADRDGDLSFKLAWNHILRVGSVHAGADDTPLISEASTQGDSVASTAG